MFALTSPLYPLGFIMGKAWEYARLAQATCGGKLKDWLPAGMARAWSETKSDPVAQEIRKIKQEIRAARAGGKLPRGPTKREQSRTTAWFGR
jgi:hypothetical protein